ncbi:unnamed protein product [Calypogeia fissa]
MLLNEEEFASTLQAAEGGGQEASERWLGETVNRNEITSPGYECRRYVGGEERSKFMACSFVVMYKLKSSKVFVTEKKKLEEDSCSEEKGLQAGGLRRHSSALRLEDHNHNRFQRRQQQQQHYSRTTRLIRVMATQIGGSQLECRKQAMRTFSSNLSSTSAVEPGGQPARQAAAAATASLLFGQGRYYYYYYN